MSTYGSYFSDMVREAIKEARAIRRTGKDHGNVWLRVGPSDTGADVGIIDERTGPVDRGLVWAFENMETCSPF